MPELNIDAKVLDAQENAVYIKLTGFLDGHTSPRLKAVFEKLYSKESVKIIVDMAGVSYISSTGIGTLMGALNLSEKNKGVLKICSLPTKILNIISMLGFDQVLPIHKTSEEAISLL
ncbi:MAG: STAS domain-containing protein [Candidatus Hydrogenedentota bacterium]